MRCPSCNTELASYVKTMVKEIEGKLEYFYWCDMCPSVKEEVPIFPRFIIKGNKEEEHRELMASRLPDYRQRERDDVSNLDNRETFIYAAHGGPRVQSIRQEEKLRRFNGRFGPGNWREISDDGVVAKAEGIRKESSNGSY